MMEAIGDRVLLQQGGTRAAGISRSLDCYPFNRGGDAGCG